MLPALRELYPEHNIEILLRKAGAERIYAGRNRRKTAVVGKIFEVLLDSTGVGFIDYDLATRERRVAGRTYVEARWQSPAWFIREDVYSRRLEQLTKTDAATFLINLALER